MKFNENLKYLRKQARLTQEQLAEKLSVSRQAITKWESGESLPDVENLKELSYIFSVSIDSLLGDIESKSTSKLNKKINDIGWFIFAIVFVLANFIFSIGNFIGQVFNDNENIIIPSYILMTILGFIIFILSIKLYLKNTKDFIIDMNPTKEGKSIRIRHIIKTSILFLCLLVVFDIIDNLYLLPQSIEQFTKFAFSDMIGSIVFVIVLGIIDYIRLENKIKNLNDVAKNEKRNLNND